MYFVPILTASLFMVITCMNLNGDLCWMNMTIRWESELGLSTFRNRPDIVGFGDNLSGRSRPSNFPKKKDSHKLVWPSNYINIRLGWEFLKTIWVWKSFLGRRPYKLPLRFQNLACSFNFWQHAPRRQLSLNFWIRSNFFEISKGRTLFQAGIILWKSFSDSYVGGFFFRISESEAKEWMFPIQKE